MAPVITNESVIVAAIIHNIEKLGHPGKPYYLPNDYRWKIEIRGKSYKDNPKIVTMNLAMRILLLVSKYITLAEEEAQAIVAHDWLYPVNGGVVNLEYYHKECRLTMILHFAEFWTATVGEEVRR